MLTELQRRVRSIVAQLPESGVFALAGGAALEYFDEINPEAFSVYTDDYDQLRDCVEASRRSLDPPQRGAPSRGIEL